MGEESGFADAAIAVELDPERWPGAGEVTRREIPTELAENRRRGLHSITYLEQAHAQYFIVQYLITIHHEVVVNVTSPSSPANLEVVVAAVGVVFHVDLLEVQPDDLSFLGDYHGNTIRLGRVLFREVDALNASLALRGVVRPAAVLLCKEQE